MFPTRSIEMETDAGPGFSTAIAGVLYRDVGQFPYLDRRGPMCLAELHASPLPTYIHGVETIEDFFETSSKGIFLATEAPQGSQIHAKLELTRGCRFLVRTLG
jgi:hypothetical protein